MNQNELKNYFGFEEFVYKQIKFGEQVSLRFPRQIQQRQVVILELQFQASDVDYFRVLQACNGLNKKQPYLYYITKDTNLGESYEERKKRIYETQYTEENLLFLKFIGQTQYLEVSCDALYTYSAIVNIQYYSPTSECKNGDTCLLYFLFINDDLTFNKNDNLKKKGIDMRVLYQNQQSNNYMSPIDLSFYYSKQTQKILNYDKYPLETEDPEFTANFFPIVPAQYSISYMQSEMYDIIQPFHFYIKPDQEGIELAAFFSSYKFRTQPYQYYTIENYFDENGNINDIENQIITQVNFVEALKDQNSYEIIKCIGNDQHNNCAIIVEVTHQGNYTIKYQDSPHYYIEPFQSVIAGSKIKLDCNKLINSYKLITESDSSPYFSFQILEKDREKFDEQYGAKRFFMIGEQPVNFSYKQDVMVMKNPLDYVPPQKNNSMVEFALDPHIYYSQIVTTNANSKFVYVQVNTFFAFQHYIEDQIQINTLSLDNLIQDKKAFKKLTYTHNQLIPAKQIDSQYLFFYKARKGHNKLYFTKTKGYIKFFINKCGNLNVESCLIPTIEHYQYFAQHYWDQTMYLLTENTDKEELYAILMVKLAKKKPGDFPFTITDVKHTILESQYTQKQLIIIFEIIILCSLPFICLIRQQYDNIKIIKAIKCIFKSIKYRLKFKKDIYKQQQDEIQMSTLEDQSNNKIN